MVLCYIFFMSTIVYFYSFAFIIKILLERSCNVNKFLCTQIFTKDDSFFRTSKILLVMQFDFFKAFYFFTLFSMGGGYFLEIYCRSQIYYIRLIIEEEGSSISPPPLLRINAHFNFSQFDYNVRQFYSSKEIEVCNGLSFIETCN